MFLLVKGFNVEEKSRDKRSQEVEIKRKKKVIAVDKTGIVDIFRWMS